MRKAGRTKVAMAALLLAGCQPELENVWELKKHRVLGVRLDPPEAARGESVQVQIVTAAADTMLNAQTFWVVCPVALSPTSGSGAGFACEGAQFNTLPTGTITVPMSGGAPDANGREVLTLLGSTCAGGRLRLPTSSNPLPGCEGENGTGWLFSKSIVVKPQNPVNPANSNPQITAVRFGHPSRTVPWENNAPPVVARCENADESPGCFRYEVSVDFSSNSRETYMAPDPTTGLPAQRTERLTTGFVVTAGRLTGGFRTDSSADPQSKMANAWVAPATAGPVRLIVYVSDGRGGFDWTERSLTVQ